MQRLGEELQQMEKGDVEDVGDGVAAGAVATDAGGRVAADAADAGQVALTAHVGPGDAGLKGAPVAVVAVQWRCTGNVAFPVDSINYE